MNSQYTEAVKAFQNRVLAYMDEKSSLGSTFFTHGFDPYAPESVRNLLIKYPAFHECHIEVRKTSLTTLEQIKIASTDTRITLTPLMGITSFDEYPRVFIVVAISLLILIGKHVIESNRIGWLKNRWRAVAHVAGFNMQFDSVFSPELAPCQGLYLISSTLRPVPCSIF